MAHIIHVLPQILARDTSKSQKKSGRGRHGNSRTTVPAEHILDMRRRHELDGQPLRKVAAFYSQYPAAYVRRVLAYEIRASLRVKLV